MYVIKYGIFVCYYIISNSFLPTQVFNFYRHKTEEVFLFFVLKIIKSTNVCTFTTKKGVILPRI